MANTDSHVLANFPAFEAMLVNATFKEDGYVDLPNSLFPEELSSFLTALAKSFGVDFQEAGHTISVKVTNGLVDKIYEPAILADSYGNVVVSWGKVVKPLEPDNFKISNGSKGEWVVNPVDDAGWDYDEDCTLRLLLSGNKVKEQFPDGGFADLKVRPLNTMFKNGTLADLLIVKGSGGDFPQKAHKVLKAGGVYQVIGYGSQPGEYQGRKFTTDYMVLKGDEFPKGTIKVVAKGNVQKMLACNPEISEEKPATLRVLSFTEQIYKDKSTKRETAYTSVEWVLQPSTMVRNLLSASENMPF